MVSTTQIKDEIKKNKSNLYNSFFQTYKYDFDFKKIKNSRSFKRLL